MNPEIHVLISLWTHAKKLPLFDLGVNACLVNQAEESKMASCNVALTHPYVLLATEPAMLASLTSHWVWAAL